MRAVAIFALSWIFLMSTPPAALAKAPQQDLALNAPDSDHDGLSDDLEQALLKQFAPSFMVSPHDCSNTSASFTPNLPNPIVQAEDSTIYGQVFPLNVDGSTQAMVEIHYYHLWKRDCGRIGHPLDAEHVSVLIRAGSDQTPSNWRATYWYAAAHQDTVCEASQISRASTLHAEDRGPAVWISSGKHASFLDQRLCSRGCGGDNCEKLVSLAVNSIVNLGESSEPMNGASWASSPQWVLKTKMVHSDFQPAAVARLELLPTSDIAWANPVKGPKQGTIAVSNKTANAIATGNRDTDSAISLAKDSTGKALSKSYQNVKRFLRRTAQSGDKNAQPDAEPKPKP
jgi:hypothetical protein